MLQRKRHNPAAAPVALLPLFVVLLVTVARPATAFSAFSIDLPAHAEHCFYEELHKDERLDLSYQVTDGGNLDIDFAIYAPNSRPIYTFSRGATTSFGFNAEMDGRYVYCFSNKMSSVTNKLVTFTLQGPDERPLQEEVRQMADGIRAIRDEQAYLMQREAMHRKTAESTNSRVAWWSLFETAVLIAVCIFQVSYLKRFFEVKRLV
ncbi:supernatant protein factor, C-terminal domain-containing protein [Blyttiomyces helicus]|uniref:Supernatant protein factor, C-terminal domain-containing protein n=1 Tax=Blyttiomyces helicus TaxID=388810 RepID=A0A4P9VYA0_9FUNG|nr:supernatant protein factor, C-terminal domain-containing protein [Blyttiomyces helicus]|eukprot:RKO83290.1 supernatant protein factor, C-terminal domain-containing protein [Blyttiomyces helicus]